MSRDDPARMDDAELRLECARLAAVFCDGGDIAANTEKLYGFIRGAQPSLCPHCGYDLRAEETVSFGSAAIERRGEFTYAGVVIHLSPCERNLVESLLRARGRLVPIMALAERMDTNSDDPANSIHVLAARVRKRLRAHGFPGELLHSEINRGMRWAVEAEQAAAQ